MNQSNFVDLTGKKFGFLSVKAYQGYKAGGAVWLCVCDCGKEGVFVGRNLRTGRTKSCGCNAAKLISSARIRHGYARAGKVRREHRIWRGMLSRCGNPNVPGWDDYGGRGIVVCDRWKNFENFISDMGDCPEGYSIERKDNDGNYDPGNCCWATRKEQAANRRKRRYHKKPQVLRAA